jgi:hypothetical protein
VALRAAARRAGRFAFLATLFDFAMGHLLGKASL